MVVLCSPVKGDITVPMYQLLQAIISLGYGKFNQPVCTLMHTSSGRHHKLFIKACSPTEEGAIAWSIFEQSRGFLLCVGMVCKLTIPVLGQIESHWKLIVCKLPFILPVLGCILIFLVSVIQAIDLTDHCFK